MANFLIEVLRIYMRADKFQVIDFVIMPDHVHLILRVPADSSVEKCVQLIKGGFSFRAHRELGFQGEVWQRGYSEMRIHDEERLKSHHEYIAKNPVKAGLVASQNEYPFCFKFLKDRKTAGAKVSA
jgi:putative transposase